MFNDISFTQVMGDFTLKNGAVHFAKFDLRNPMLQMQATGKIGFNKQVDLDLHLAFLSAYLGWNIPIVKNIMAIIEKFGGGPVGLDTVAAAVSEEPDTIMDVVEPYLLQLGFLDRTPRGRVATARAYDHLGIPYQKPEQPALL